MAAWWPMCKGCKPTYSLYISWLLLWLIKYVNAYMDFFPLSPSSVNYPGLNKPLFLKVIAKIMLTVLFYCQSNGFQPLLFAHEW